MPLLCQKILKNYMEYSKEQRFQTKKNYGECSIIINRFEIIEVNAGILNKALTSEISDYEDAVIEASSIEKKIEYILTRNIKDFKKSIINAITPEELLIILKKSGK